MSVGVLLAGGLGERLEPLTNVVNKHLLPVGDKPMVYYPLATLFELGIRDVLVISSPESLPLFRDLLGDGTRFGAKLEYAEQKKPRGVADALLIADEAGFWPEGERLTLVLGDNVFVDLPLNVLCDPPSPEKARICAARVDQANRYGVLSLDEVGRPTDIVEKPKRPASSWAVAGLYDYPRSALHVAKGLSPSTRGEIEITDVSLAFLNTKRLEVCFFQNSTNWLDAGTCESLAQAGEVVRTTQWRQNRLIGSPEWAAYCRGWISGDQVLSRAGRGGEYHERLRSLVRDFD